MQRLSRLLQLALACGCLLALTAAASAPAATPTRWLCKPGVTPDPCAGSLETTLISPAGDRAIAAAERPFSGRSRTDCFYVYPTVSEQGRTNATLRVDPEQSAIAKYQAARYAQTCRVYAPMYRQLTLQAIATPRGAAGAAQRLAYGDVRDAWREYLRRFNKGRGVILIGHSQGTYMLRELVKREIDDRPAVRRRLVAAHLIGGNVTVRRGSDRGGDFAHVPACRKSGQVGCVVAYSMFDTQPPASARFGRTSERGLQVLCTNPASLRGGAATLDTLSPTTPFPGTLGIAVNASTTLPQVSTPWIGFPGRSTARCRNAGGAQWLQVDPAGGANDTRPVFKATIGPDWGLHLGDMNLAMGTLTTLAERQAAAYLRRR